MYKKLKIFVFLTVFSSFLFGENVFAQTGDMGFFGGISEGTSLPKISETVISNVQKGKKGGKNKNKKYVYKEMIFIGGEPKEFEGIMTIKSSGDARDTDLSGTYKETYSVGSSDVGVSDISLERDITFNVNYRKEGFQVIKDYEVEKWQETIKIPQGSYELDPEKSEFGISILEDHRPGITYYKGDISQKAVYSAGDGKSETILDVSGSFYGYDSPYSSTETHRLDNIVTTDNWQSKLQVRPSISVNKQIKFSKNEPETISFPGNFKQILQNTSGLEYNIYVKPKEFYDISDNGKTNIPSFNSFEQLIAPEMEFLDGHHAEYDIKRLFAMEILEGDPKFYVPDQTITKGEYIKALAKTLNLDVAIETKNNKNETEIPVFLDVTKDQPEYPYIMSAYEAGLVVGQDGNFNADALVDRQEAIVTLIRAVGLENLEQSSANISAFADDYKIADWAKEEIYVAYKIGIIKPDENGNINPTQYVSKSEIAAYLNGLIDFMSSDLVKDYADNIVNYVI